MLDPAATARRPTAEAATRHLEGALGRAKWVLLWERVCPPLAGVLTVTGLFLAVSWLGLWLWLPPMGRAVGIFVFFVLLFPPFIVALVLALFRIPSRFDRLRRLHPVSRLAHPPSTALPHRTATPESAA